MSAGMEFDGSMRWLQSPVQVQAAESAKDPGVVQPGASEDGEMMQVLASGFESNSSAEDIGVLEYHDLIVDSKLSAPIFPPNIIVNNTGSPFIALLNCYENPFNTPSNLPPISTKEELPIILQTVTFDDERAETFVVASCNSNYQFLNDPRRKEREKKHGSDDRGNDDWESWAIRMRNKYLIFYRGFECKDKEWNKNRYGGMIAQGKNVATMPLQNRDGTTGTAYLGAVWNIPCGNRMMRVELWATDDCVRICHVLGANRLWMGRCRWDLAHNNFIPQANGKWKMVNTDKDTDENGKHRSILYTYDYESGIVVITHHLLDNVDEEPNTSNQTRTEYRGMGFVNPFDVH